MPDNKDLVKKKIFFDPPVYKILKETSDNTGDGFSIIINELIKEHLPHNYDPTHEEYEDE
jgi:hypothetical protein